MIKLRVLRIVFPLLILVAAPRVAQLSETPEDSQAEVDLILKRYIEAIGGQEAIEKLQTRTCKGHIITDLKSRKKPIYEDHYFEAYSKVPDLYYAIEHSDAGGFINGYDGVTGWSKDRCRVKKDDYHARSKIAWVLNPQSALKIKDYFPDLIFEGQTQIDIKKVYKLKPANRDETYYSLYFDIDTGILTAIGYHWYLEDYRGIDGVLFPFKVVAGRKGGSTTYLFDEVIHNQPLEDETFQMPEK